MLGEKLGIFIAIIVFIGCCAASAKTENPTIDLSKYELDGPTEDEMRLVRDQIRLVREKHGDLIESLRQPLSKSEKSFLIITFFYESAELATLRDPEKWDDAGFWKSEMDRLSRQADKLNADILSEALSYECLKISSFTDTKWRSHSSVLTVGADRSISMQGPPWGDIWNYFSVGKPSNDCEYTYRYSQYTSADGSDISGRIFKERSGSLSLRQVDQNFIIFMNRLWWRIQHE